MFSIPSNVHMADIECPQGLCVPTFVVDHFSELFKEIK